MIRMDNIILASGSPRRRELLKQAGIPFTVMVSDADETTEDELPSEMVKTLSRKKAQAVFDKLIFEDPECGSLVIGADTLVWADGQVLGKPVDRDDARRMLRLICGRTHSVFTGVTIIGRRNGRIKTDSFACETLVRVHEMDEEETESYLSTKEPYDKAGAYGIQGAFGIYIDGIEGDYYNVVGLPIAEVYRHLRDWEKQDVFGFGAEVI